MSLKSSFQWILKQLNRPLIDTPYIFVQGWSFVHILSGASLGFFISNPLVAFIFITIYELYEYILMAHKVILRESFPDTIWDFIFTFGAYLLIRWHFFGF